MMVGLGVAAVLVVVLALCSQVAWWAFKCYFPTERVAEIVHRNLDGWFARERAVLHGFEYPTAIGGLLTALMICVIALNVTLLAQVFELFLPKGSIIILPYLGRYGVNTLIAGTLFALIQVAVSTIWKMQRSEGKKAIGLLFLLAATVLFECGLNYYRVRIVTGGELLVAPTFWDRVIFEAGPALAALLGFIVPVGEILMASIAMQQFVLPTVKDVFVLARVALTYPALGLVWAVGGWHPVAPGIPKSIADLMAATSEVEGLGTDLRGLVHRLKEIIRDLNQIRVGDEQSVKQAYADVEKKTAETCESHERSRSALEAGVTALIAAPAATQGLHRQLEQRRGDVKSWRPACLEQVGVCQHAVGRLDADLLVSEKCNTKWAEKQRLFLAQQAEAIRLEAEVGMRLERVRRWSDEIGLAMNGFSHEGYEVITLEAQRQELRDMSLAKTQGCRYARFRCADAERIQGLSKDALHRIESQLRTVSSELSALTQMQESRSPATGSIISGLRDSLATMYQQLEGSRQAAIKQYSLWRSDLRGKAWEAKFFGHYLAMLVAF